MNLLSTILNFFKTGALDIWSKVSLSFNAIFNTLVEDEVALLGTAKEQFLADLAAGKSYGEAVADVWTTVENAEGAELSKVGNLLLQAFLAHFEPAASE
jgi:hypothetical protein